MRAACLPPRFRRGNALPVLLACGLVLSLAEIAVAAEPDALPAHPQVETIPPITLTAPPQGLVPGSKGKLGLEIALEDPRLHIKVENLSFAVKAGPGVVIDTAAVVWGAEPTVITTTYGDIENRRVGKIGLGMPFVVAEDAAPGTTAELTVTYEICSDDTCGPQRKKGFRLTVPAKPNDGAPADGRVPRTPKGIARSEGVVSVVPIPGESTLRVRFAPSFGHYFYLPPGDGSAQVIAVEPILATGVRWGDVVVPEGKTFEDPVTVDVPYERDETVTALEIDVKWMGCSATACLDPRSHRFRIEFELETPAGANATGQETRPDPNLVETIEEAPRVVGEQRYEHVDGDVFDGAAVSDSALQERLRSSGLFLTLLFVFGVGAALTFTPCVFPIIPLVVATIAGGRSIPRGRLTSLLGVYVLGLSLAFATIGLAASLGGASMSAAFENPIVIGVIALLFIALSFGMLGLFELQPPQWLMRLQGGAQARGGSFLGAFLLGVLGAVLASPCTGPVIAGMIVATSQLGDALLGFSLFFTFGLGMGCVIALFGSANMALRPGPWMVWVRYVFGVLLFGGALYYAASSSIVGRTALVVVGVGVTLLALVLLYRHLVHKEREEPAKARRRGGLVAGFYALALVAVMLMTTPLEGGVVWQKPTSMAEFDALVAKSVAAGRPIVVDFWGNFCPKCKEYDRVFAGDADLMEKFEQVTRIKIDETGGIMAEIRDALGVSGAAKPLLVFIDRQGRVRSGATAEWLGAEPGEKSENEAAADRVRQRLDFLLET